MAWSADTLDGTQRIRGFDCACWRVVARENYPAFIGFRQAQELVHLLAADLTSLIDKDHTPRGKFPRARTALTVGHHENHPVSCHDLLPLVGGDDRDRCRAVAKR